MNFLPTENGRFKNGNEIRGGGVCSCTTLTLRIFFQKFEKTVMMPRIPDAHGLKNIGFNITKNLNRPKNIGLKISKSLLFTGNPELPVLSLKA